MFAPRRRRVLVSFCNYTEPGGSALVEVDLETRAWTPVPSLTGKGLGHGFTGICRADGVIVVAYQGTEAAVALLDPRTLDVVGERGLPGASDVHSIASHRGGLAVASTGTDEIMHYPLRRGVVGKARTLLSFGEERSDRHHVNAIFPSRRGVLWSAFGPRPDDGWQTAAEGAVGGSGRRAPLMDGLLHPHSVRVHGSEVFICESGSGCVRTAKRIVGRVDGYVRGLDFLDRRTALVGTSVGRTRSRSTGRIFSRLQDGVDAGSCALHQLDVRTGAALPIVSFDGYAREIYDVFVF